MGVVVRVPAPLRRVTNGRDKLDVAASNLADLIDQMDVQHSGIKERLVDENGEIRYFVNIYLNGEDVRFLQGILTDIKDGDEVSIVPAVAGGC